MKLVAKINRKYYKREIVEYPEGVVKFESAIAGTYSASLNAGQYEIICVGGGGGGAQTGDTRSFNTGAGGSGGYSNELVQLTAGDYEAIVGAGGAVSRAWWPTNTFGGQGGTSSFAGVEATGGAGGGAGGQGVWGGAGGTGATANGNTGSAGGGKNVYYPGGASVYNGYGLGGNGYSGNASTMAGSSPGGAGYIKVTCFSEEISVPSTADDYDFYEDVPIMNAVVNNNKLYAFNR